MARKALPSEGRKQARIPANDGVLALHLDQDGRIVYGRVVDVGHGGMCFEFPSKCIIEPESTGRHELKGKADIVSLQQDLLITDLPVAGVADFHSSDPQRPWVQLCRRRLRFGPLDLTQTELLRNYLLINRIDRTLREEQTGESMAENGSGKGAVMNSQYKVILVEDHAVLRNELLDLLGEWPEFRVVAQAGDGEEALRKCEFHTPNVVILDLSLPRMSGMEALRQMKRRWPQMSILILTMHQDRRLLDDAMAAGATAFCRKDISMEDLLEALRSTARGEKFVCPSLKDWAPGEEEFLAP